MPLTSILVIAFIVTMFTTFAAVLAYGEYQTRNIRRVPDKTPETEPAEQEWLKAA